MATVVTMPKLGLTMTEGTIERWLKQEGDRVEKGEPLVEIITEKISFQYESPASGILQKILHHEGEAIPVTTPIAVIAEEGERWVEAEEAQSEMAVRDRQPPVVQVVQGATKASRKRIVATPLAKRTAKERGVDLSSLGGSGPRGRIVKSDILKAVEKRGVEIVSPPPPFVEKPRGKLIPLKGIRKIVARRMTESFQNIPHFYIAVEVDMTACLALREQLMGEVEKRGQVRLTVTDILIKVTASTLRDHPMINSRIEGEQIRLMEEVNMGVAIALQDGLIVPVIHNADRKSLAEIAVTLRSLTQKAKEGKLSLDDVGDGTFTLSNLGMLGIDKFNAIINPPECSILGVGRTVEKPVVQGGEVKVRPMAWFSLSSDHRIVDGATAALFLNHVKDLLENPALLLI